MSKQYDSDSDSNTNIHKLNLPSTRKKGHNRSVSKDSIFGSNASYSSGIASFKSPLQRVQPKKHVNVTAEEEVVPVVIKDKNELSRAGFMMSLFSNELPKNIIPFNDNIDIDILENNKIIGGYINKRNYKTKEFKRKYMTLEKEYITIYNLTYDFNGEEIPGGKSEKVKLLGSSINVVSFEKFNRINVFEVYNSDTKKSYTFDTDSEKSLTNWVVYIRTAMSRVNKKQVKADAIVYDKEKQDESKEKGFLSSVVSLFSESPVVFQFEIKLSEISDFKKNLLVKSPDEFEGFFELYLDFNGKNTKVASSNSMVFKYPRTVMRTSLFCDISQAYLEGVNNCNLNLQLVNETMLKRNVMLECEMPLVKLLKFSNGIDNNFYCKKNAVGGPIPAMIILSIKQIVRHRELYSEWVNSKNLIKLNKGKNFEGILSPDNFSVTPSVCRRKASSFGKLVESEIDPVLLSARSSRSFSSEYIITSPEAPKVKLSSNAAKSLKMQKAKKLSSLTATEHQGLDADDSSEVSPRDRSSTGYSTTSSKIRYSIKLDFDVNMKQPMKDNIRNPQSMLQTPEKRISGSDCIIS